MQKTKARKSVSFTAQKREELRVAYAQAVAAKKEQFTFEGHELLVDYAKYLLQFLDAQL